MYPQRRDQLLSAHASGDAGEGSDAITRVTRRMSFAHSQSVVGDRWTRSSPRVVRLLLTLFTVGRGRTYRDVSHWAGRQHGRDLGGARRSDGTGGSDGRRAEHPLQSCDFRSPSGRTLPLPLQETHLRHYQNFTSGFEVSIITVLCHLYRKVE